MVTVFVLKIKDVDSNERNVETGQDRSSEDEGTVLNIEQLRNA
jgi:hypothetical protein